MPELAGVQLFEGIPAKELVKIGQRMREVQQPAGNEVAVSGDPGIGFMVILSGEAEARLHNGRTRTLQRGDYYGEMALLDEHGRSATIVAKTDLTLAVIPRWEFKEFLQDHPDVAWRLLQILSRRLREAEETTAS